MIMIVVTVWKYIDVHIAAENSVHLMIVIFIFKNTGHLFYCLQVQALQSLESIFRSRFP